jgi:hypothetical protein
MPHRSRRRQLFLNPDAPNVEPFRSRLAGFDALATLAVWHYAPGDRDHPYYP